MTCVIVEPRSGPEPADGAEPPAGRWRTSVEAAEALDRYVDAYLAEHDRAPLEGWER